MEVDHDANIAALVRDIIDISEALAPWAAENRAERERLAPYVEELRRERDDRQAGKV